MKVSLYIRQRGTGEFQKHNPKKSYPQNGSIIWVLRLRIDVGDPRREDAV